MLKLWGIDSRHLADRGAAGEQLWVIPTHSIIATRFNASVIEVELNDGTVIMARTNAVAYKMDRGEVLNRNSWFDWAEF